MADVAPVLAKVRALGADVVLERGKMTIIGSVHLNTDQRAWIAQHREAVETHLRQTGGGDDVDDLPKTWGEFARILYSACPENVDACDWSWFVTMAGKVVRGESEVEAS